MTTTTGYGNWSDATGHDTPEDEVSVFADGHITSEVVSIVAQRYRALVNDALDPHGIVSAGREFYGPYPRIGNASEIIRGALAGVDLGALVEEVEGLT